MANVVIYAFSFATQILHSISVDVPSECFHSSNAQPAGSVASLIAPGNVAVVFEQLSQVKVVSTRFILTSKFINLLCLQLDDLSPYSADRAPNHSRSSSALDSTKVLVLTG